mgnify:CR=1 FL=1
MTVFDKAKGKINPLPQIVEKTRVSLGPLCEGAPPAGGGGENRAAGRNISGHGKVLSLRPFGAPPSQREVRLSKKCIVGVTIGRPRTPAAMASLPGGYRIRPCGVGAGHARPGGVWQTGVYGKAAGRTCPAPTSPLKLKPHLFRQVCRGRIYASRAVYPLYRMIGTAAAGGIYAAPTSQPILFILVYGRGRGMPRPYTCNRGKTHPHS